jgi:peptidoglycan hydrolase CwlO-like protein
MANDKKNINELVTDDDDPTAELEALVFDQPPSGGEQDDLSETAASTHDYVGPHEASPDASITELESDLRHRSETISRLQFDIEQLHAKWVGLETEIEAREELTKQLNSKLDESASKLARKEKLLKKRDQAIKSLKAEIRARSDEFGTLKATVIEREQRIDELEKEIAVDLDGEVERDRQLLEQQAGQIASAEMTINELHAQIARTESYADSLRHQLQEQSSATSETEDSRQFLQAGLDRATAQLQELGESLAAEKATGEALRKQLSELQDAHAEEIRNIRFELGQAEETVAQQELVAEQLASDLIDTRGFRDELEGMLNKSLIDNQSRIETLEEENRKLRGEAVEFEEKLATKSDAINCLLAELAKKSEQIDSIGNIENMIHEIDDRMSERIDDRSGKERDRVTRLLIGSVDDQELRFPLFKDRLTIGRTEQNDIQLKASYVSRRHAVVVTERDATRVIDWGSKNGVFVNSKRVNEHFLQNGDIVTIGTADFRYEERPKRDT